MSATVEDQVALAVLTQLNRAPHVERLATRLRWRLQWESAYLAEQVRLAARQSHGPELPQTQLPADPGPTQSIAGEQISSRPQSPSESPAKFAETHLPKQQIRVAHIGTVLSRSHAIPLVPAAQAHLGRVVSPMGPAPRSQPPAAAHTQRYLPALEPYQANAVRVEWANGGIRLLIRDSDLQPRAGLIVTARIRSALASSGVRLTDVYLNGELLWREEPDARQGELALSEEQGHAIDEVY